MEAATSAERRRLRQQRRPETASERQRDTRTTQRDLTTSDVCSRIWQVHLAGARRQVDELGGKHVIKET